MNCCEKVASFVGVGFFAQMIKLFVAQFDGIIVLFTFLLQAKKKHSND